MRYAREGQGDDIGWEGRKGFTITIKDTNDMQAIIEGGALRRLLVEENDPKVIYTPKLTRDDAVTRTEWKLSGDDAKWLRVDQRTGVINFKAPPDYEAPRDKDGDNRYKVTLSVKTFDDDGREQSATQDIEFDVNDVSIVINAADRKLQVREDYVGRVAMIRHLVEEDDVGSVTYSLSGPYPHLYRIAPSAGHGREGVAELNLIRPLYLDAETVDFGDGLLQPVTGVIYLVNVVVTATWEDGSTKTAIRPIWITVQNNPDAPTINLTSNPGFYILTTERSALRDTGYRAVARDKDGNPVKLSMRDNERFKIDEDNRIWIKKKKVFESDDTEGVMLFLKATDTSPDSNNVAILKFKIPVKPRLDNIDDMFRIVGDAEVSVDENLPVETAIFAPTIVWGAGYESSMPVIWSLGGTDSRLLRIDAATGVVRFITSPDFESKKTVYEFTITAVAVGGQLVNRKAVTINIQDVDEAPSEMLIVGLHDDLDFTPAELTNNANRKLAKIRFKDVDSQAGNDVEIDAASQEFFEIRQATHADGTIKEGAYRLWLKDDVTLEVSSYTITITAVINGARVEDMQQEFTFTVTTPEQETPATVVDETPSVDDQTSDDGDTDDGQPNKNRSDDDNEIDSNRQPTGDDTNGNQSVDQKRNNELPPDIENNDTEENPENPNELPQTLNGGSPQTQSARPPANTPPSDPPSSDNLDGQPPPGNQSTEVVSFEVPLEQSFQTNDGLSVDVL